MAHPRHLSRPWPSLFPPVAGNSPWIVAPVGWPNTGRTEPLAASAAERRFLEQLPLADGVREANWLNTPADWSRIADSAMAWGLRRQLADGTTYCCATDLAAAWWETEVMPVVGSWRQHAAHDTATTDLPDLQVFLAALAHRDSLGSLDWVDPANEHAPCR